MNAPIDVFCKEILSGMDSHEEGADCIGIVGKVRILGDGLHVGPP